MNDSKISVRYSKALFQLALDKKLLDAVNKDMILISEMCKTPEAKEFIHNPVIRPSKKTAIFHALFEGNVEEMTLSLIDLVVKNGRESFLPSIARVFVHETLKFHGITETYLTSAVEVNEEIKKEISSLVAEVFNTKIDLKENIDPQIVGGFILRIGDKYIDASLRNKLRKIKKELTGSIVAS
jgi:F-type H+-transporting ATPase subunit delta